MFWRILVPLDGSMRAEQALPVAARLARASGGSIILTRVIDTSTEHLPSAPAKPVLAQTVGARDQAMAESYLAGMVASELLAGISVQTYIHFGLVAPTILSTAISQQADIIVMCSHGLSGVKRWIMGSVAEKVVHYADIPVLVLREGGSIPGERASSEGQTARVLVPLDGSESSRAVIGPAAHLATALAAPGQGALHLLRVIKSAQSAEVGTTSPTDKVEPQANLLAARRYLEETVQFIRDGKVASEIARLNLDITWSATTDKDVAAAIINIAEHGVDQPFRSCDAIAMTTFGYGGLQRWSMGSVTGRVLQATQLPLLIVRPGSNRA